MDDDQPRTVSGRGCYCWTPLDSIHVDGRKQSTVVGESINLHTQVQCIPWQEGEEEGECFIFKSSAVSGKARSGPGALKVHGDPGSEVPSVDTYRSGYKLQNFNKQRMRLSRLIFDEGFFALFCEACRPKVEEKEEEEVVDPSRSERGQWPAATEASSEDTQVPLEELESEVESLIILKIICWIAAVRMCGRPEGD